MEPAATLVRLGSSRNPGASTAVTPPTARLLNTLLPSTLPTRRAVSSRRADWMAVTSSGSDVPTATRVRPTNPPDSPRSAATPVAPRTRSWAPTTVAANTTKVRTRSRRTPARPPAPTWTGPP